MAFPAPSRLSRFEPAALLGGGAGGAAEVALGCASCRGTLVREAFDDERWSEDGPVFVDGFLRGAGAGGGAMLLFSVSVGAEKLVGGTSLAGVLTAGDDV